MLEDFGQEVDLIGTEDGHRSFFWTRLKYVPLGKLTWITEPQTKLQLLSNQPKCSEL